jgi:hypothetical protein
MANTTDEQPTYPTLEPILNAIAKRVCVTNLRGAGRRRSPTRRASSG